MYIFQDFKVIEHLLVKDYNNDILKSNNHVHLNIFL